MVKHPTQDLTLLPAEDANDLKDAIIGDPRTILLDLAIGRLFARRFVRDEPTKKTRIVFYGEVRVYVLDGSGSMLGTRARVRDAILIAELSTVMKRLERPRDVRCTLFYRYFDEQLGPQRRVETAKDAQVAIRDVVRTDRQGGTDIQLALVSSLEQIAEARAIDPELARAQIVLVTDGESEVDEATLVAARAKIGGIPVGISVIALGAENPALRGLVARQRAKGEAAFYHYLDDADCEAIATGRVAGKAVHAPPEVGRARRGPARARGRARRPRRRARGDRPAARRRRPRTPRRRGASAPRRRPRGRRGRRAGRSRPRGGAPQRPRRARRRFARWFPKVEPAADRRRAPGTRHARPRRHRRRDLHARLGGGGRPARRCFDLRAASGRDRAPRAALARRPPHARALSRRAYARLSRRSRLAPRAASAIHDAITSKLA